MHRPCHREFVAIAIKAGFQAKGESGGDTIMKRLSIFDWYRVLRVHHQWTIFQAVRYALWLAR